MINIDDTLVSLPKVYSGYFKSTSEQMKVFEFTVPTDGCTEYSKNGSRVTMNLGYMTVISIKYPKITFILRLSH